MDATNKPVLLNMNPQNTEAGHVAAYWQRDDNFIWTKKVNGQPDEKIRTGMRLCKYRDYTLLPAHVVGVAQRYDGNSTIKLGSGDQITIDLTREETLALIFPVAVTPKPKAKK